MRPAQNMQVNISSEIQERCNKFVENFNNKGLNSLPIQYKHNNIWIESLDKLIEVTDDIFNTL